MTWCQKVLVSSVIAVCAYLCVPVFGYTCFYIVCDDNEYCCGEDTCCFRYSSIWYVWVMMVVGILSCVFCCCYRYKRRASNGIVVAQPVVRGEQPTAVIISTQQQVQPHPGQYGAFGGANPQYNWQNQQKYTDPSSVYQAGGYYGGNSEAPPAYTYGPPQNAVPPYQQAPQKTPNAPQWK